MSIPFPDKLYDTGWIVPVVDTGAYGAGDAIGVAQKLQNVLKLSGNAGTLKKITVIDLAKQTVAFKILFFSKTITSTDQAAFDLDDTESLLFLGAVAYATTDNVLLSDNAVGVVLPGDGYGIDFKNQYGRDLYFQLVAVSTPTFAAATDLKLKFEFEAS